MGTSPRASDIDLLLDDVAHVDVVAELGKAGSGDEADPAGPDDSDRFALRHDG